MKKLLLASLLVACGGDDGVSDSTKLVDLSTSERHDVCLQLVADYPARTVSCNGVDITLGYSPTDCEGAGSGAGAPADPGCTATVGDVRDCEAAIDALTDAQVCSGFDDGTFPPTACMALAGC